MMLKLLPSDRKNKKYMVLVPTKNGRTVSVHFGAKGYEDFTIHKDESRRNKYRQRHKNDNINDPYSPGFWSWWVLWGDSSNLKDAFNHAINKAIRILKLQKNI